MSNMAEWCILQKANQLSIKINYYTFFSLKWNIFDISVIYWSVEFPLVYKRFEFDKSNLQHLSTVGNIKSTWKWQITLVNVAVLYKI